MNGKLYHEYFWLRIMLRGYVCFIGFDTVIVRNTTSSCFFMMGLEVISLFLFCKRRFSIYVLFFFETVKCPIKSLARENGAVQNGWTEKRILSGFI